MSLFRISIFINLVPRGNLSIFAFVHAKVVREMPESPRALNPKVSPKPGKSKDLVAAGEAPPTTVAPDGSRPSKADLMPPRLGTATAALVDGLRERQPAVVAAAAASFGAIFTELAVIKSAQLKPLDSLAITGMTVVLSWTFTHVIFTLHYANLYYRPADEGAMGGLRFPGDRPPDYRDFLYYAFVIGCAAQTADVSTESRAMRRVSLAHGIVSFSFNTAILALTINVGASLLS